MLEKLLKGLILWLYNLILEGIENLASGLIDVFKMDLSYFEAHVPVTNTIIQIMMAAGWALLIGNLAFQAMRSMASGLGFEGEDPKILFARTFVFSFLLMANRQICDIGLTLTGRVMDLVGIPDSVVINTPKESNFGSGDSTWLLVVVIGIILIFQIVKFFFEIAERYVVLATLTIMAPLAFGMGGSKSTEDIFKGWARMYGSMCVMMLMNVVFLKLLLSAMATIPTGAGVLPWMLFVVAIARVARKVDDLVCRIGLNPARTGDPLGRGLPMMVTMAVVRSMGRSVAATMSSHTKSKEGSVGATGRTGPAGASGSAPRPGSPPKSGGSPGGNATRRDGYFSQRSTATTPAPGQNPAKAAGQPTGGNSPGGQKPEARKPAPEGKPGGQKPPVPSAENSTPPPSRPPLHHRDSTPPAQRQPPQTAQKNPFPSQGQAGQTGTHTQTTSSSQTRQQSESRAESTTGAAPGAQPGNNNPPVGKNGPSRPPIQRVGNPPQESSQSNRRNEPSIAREKGPSSGDTPPASRRNSPPQGAASLASGEAPPATRRNGNPQSFSQPAGESRPSPRRNDAPQAAAPPSPPSQGSGRKGEVTRPSGAEVPPDSRRNAAPTQNPQSPRRPPLNRERGDSK